MINFSRVSLLYPTSTKTILEDLSFEIAEGEIGTLISGCVNEHTILDEIINLDNDFNEISLDIDTKNNAIQTQNEIIEDCDKNIKELEQYLKDNFDVCDVCGSVK